MKKLLFYFSYITIILLALSIGCKEDDDTPVRKNYAWAVGAADSTAYGMILFSNDGGDTWIRQGEGTAALAGIDVEDVWAIDENNVWAVCSENIILKTTDGGQTWIRVQAQVIPGNPELMAISVVDHDNIWISGSNGVVYNSTNGGQTWVLHDTTFFHSGGMQGICAINSQMVYVAGGIDSKRDVIGFIARTLDGGITWDSIVLADNFNKNEWIDVASSGADHIVVYGCKSHYAFTTDGGATWKNDSLITGGVGGADINHLKMLDEQTWWGAFDLDGIYITKDGGNSWIQQQSAGPGNMFLVGIDAYNDQNALIVGMTAGWPPEGKIIKTSNGGNLWELKYHSNSPLNKVSVIKE
jgi:photosystem II stability/assembly factor-like uncharacterized protein